MAAPKPYNGHHCWNCWNVSLWVSNDEGLYNLAMDCIKRYKTLEQAARRMRRYLGDRTPDGARYTLKAVKNALNDLTA